MERIDTHASIVFLAGALAYKLKRAVRFDYLDFSTADRRRMLCEAEVRLNRRTAPTLYRGVLPVCRQDDGSYVLGGKGPVDWIVEMARFPQEALFDRLASAGRLEIGLMSPLALAIVEFHASAEPRLDHGGRAGMAWVIDGNAAGFAEYGRAALDPAASARVTEDARRELDRHASLLERRCESGFVRQCHGDLHLRNIVLLDGRPTLFDGVEFNDEIACTDVSYDLAFLLMDLWRRKLPRHANAVWNRYLADTADLAGIPLCHSSSPAVRRRARRRAPPRRRFRLMRNGAPSCTARRARTSRWPSASWIRPGLRSSPSAVSRARASRRWRSVWRRSSAPCRGRWCCAATRRGSASAAFRAWSTLVPRDIRRACPARVYVDLAERAALVVRAGHSAVVDAVYARAADRQAIEEVAAAAAVPFVGLWLDAPQPVLIERVEQRRDDPSDADAGVIHLQRSLDTGEIGWFRIDASQSPASVLSRAAERFGSPASAARNA